MRDNARERAASAALKFFHGEKEFGPEIIPASNADSLRSRSLTLLLKNALAAVSAP